MKESRTASERKLIDRLCSDADGGQVLCLLTTSFECDPEFLETEYFPSVLGLGAWSDRQWASRIDLERGLAKLAAATVFLDARCYRRRPRSFRIETVPVSLPKGRASHAKVSLLVYERAVRLLVGSANLTTPGYRKNREVAVALRASEADPAEASLIESAVSKISTIFAPWWTEGAQRVVDDALRQLRGWAAPAASDMWFAWSGEYLRPLWQQFVEKWPDGEAAQRVTIISPFWSTEGADGPLRTFLGALDARGGIQNARIRLLTEAKPDGLQTWRPVLPAAYGGLNLSDLGVEATAEAVHPEAQDADVDTAAALGGTRPLHAKVVLVEGATTSLAYMGSGNFTRRGWGFVGSPASPNIEAGLIVRRSGRARESLMQLVPPVVGKPVPLDGAAASKLALPDVDEIDLPWPAFLREAVLVPMPEDSTALALELRIVSGEVKGVWSAHIPEAASDAPVFAPAAHAQPETPLRFALSASDLSTLLERQELLVCWWELPSGRCFPLNVDHAARVGLPLSPGGAPPGEDHLLAYYQGRIAWEDLFPEPISWGDEVRSSALIEHETSRVDTSRIQAYQVREFVEALHGIRSDLRRSANTPGAMRLALLGPVSPVALARQVLAAVNEGHRTPIAAGFQLLEILVCIAESRRYSVPKHYQTAWNELVAAADDEVNRMIARLRADAPESFTATDGFARYERTIRAHCRRQLEAV